MGFTLLVEDRGLNIGFKQRLCLITLWIIKVQTFSIEFLNTKFVIRARPSRVLSFLSSFPSPVFLEFILCWHKKSFQDMFSVWQRTVPSEDLSSNLKSSALSANRFSNKQTTQQSLKYCFKVNIHKTMVCKINLFYEFLRNCYSSIFLLLLWSQTDLSEKKEGDHWVILHISLKYMWDFLKNFETISVKLILKSASTAPVYNIFIIPSYKVFNHKFSLEMVVYKNSAIVCWVTFQVPHFRAGTSVDKNSSG